ncbi:MAG TPA: hypothetical protein VGG32_02855 [Thermoplasmata archaeon]|jgi:hypothetical protein
MATHAPVKGLSVLLALGMAVLMVFVVASGSVAAAPAQVSSTPVGSWSYGVVKTVSVGPLPASDPGWVYQGTATFGYTVAIWDNNTTTTTFELTVLRTMGAAFSVQFCHPSCASPTNWVNVSYRAWEATTGISNFTTQGSVLENGVTVAAVGLQSSYVWVRSNLTESYDSHLPVLGWAVDKTRYLAGTIAGHASVTFTPSLGLFPTDLTPGTSWNSTSAFQSVGAANYSYYFAAHGPRGSAIVNSPSKPISVTANGPVSVEGAYAAGSSVEVGGVTYPAITLTVIGQFSVREGVIFVPSTVDLFGSSSPPVAGNASGATTVEQSNLDVKAFSGGHFGLVGSSWRYVTNSENPYDTASGTTDSGVAPSAAAGNPVSSTTLQGEPQTPAQVTSTQQCLTSGFGCPAAGGGSSPRSILGEVVVVGAVASIGALVALAVVARWRRLPPPAYLNAPLYPPGQTSRSAPARAPATPAAPRPPEDDPLDHLW